MTLRVGILSFAHYHASFWAEAFREDPRVTLAGLWDADTARAADAARRFQTTAFGEIEPLLDQVEAVAVCSETAQHAPLVLRAAERGRHILCEKPIATGLTDADAMQAAVDAARVSFMQSFPKRLDPINQELRDLVQSSALGRIWLARVRHGHSHGNDPAFTRGWWTDPAQSGGGTLIDEGIHAADLLRWLFGDPVLVQATTAHMLGLPVEDSAVAIFRWPDGLLGEVVTGWSMQAADQSVELYGTEGTALLSGVDLASREARPEGWLRVWRRGHGWTASPTKPRFVAGRFHHQSATCFVDSLLAGRPPPIGFAEARGALAMIRAAYRAAATGTAVELA